MYWVREINVIGKPLQQNDFNCDITTLIDDRTFSMFQTNNILPVRNVELRVFLTVFAF